MKTMKIEKHLFYADEIKRLHTLQAKEQLQYDQDEDGIRATGPLHIQGSYETMDGNIIPFEEELQMDVLAPREKLGTMPFAMQVEACEGKMDENGILVTILMNIGGLKEETEKPQKKITPQPVTTTPIPQREQTPVPDTSNSNKQDEEEAQEIITTPENEQPETEKTTVDEFEDLFEDADTTYTSYRMIVAKPNDTYASIANRYEVKEADLRACNHNKTIEAKTLVILP